MHRKEGIFLILVAVLSLSLANPTFVGLTKANPLYLTWYPTEPVTTPPIVTILSPLQNQTVNSTATVLNFTVTKPNTWVTYSSIDYMPNTAMVIGKLVSYYYVLDGIESQEVPLENTFGIRASVDYPDKPVLTTSYSINLTLTEGKHNIRVIVNCATLCYGEKDVSVSGSSEMVFFDMSLPPTIVLSVENAPFYSSGVVLDFAINKPTSRIAYSLDNQENMTLAGNTTHTALTGLSAGKHNITVYAWDVTGSIGASETVTFNSPEPFPILIFVAVTSVLAAVIVAVSIAVFRRASKKRLL
ncbi:MAG: hypothetical protein ACQCN6_14050 [Candidatus Bathyarchaeia archaeon]|jgi:hypothetical protein